VKGSSEVRP